MKKILSSLVFVAGSFMAFSQTPCPSPNPIVAPWTDDVEAHNTTFNITNTLCWTQNLYGTNNFIDWNIDGFGSTPSSSTGPSGAHSGSKYFYFETSGGGVGNNADLVAPEVDVSGLTYPGLKFWYHMFGSDMGSLTVELTDDGGTTWTNIWSISGQQQTTQGAEWRQQVLSLSGLASDTIQVRFHATDLNTGFEGDICLDDISIFDCTPSFSTINAQSCGYYTAPSGAQFHEAGTYTDVIPNAIGCDSIITINLSTGNTFSDTTVVACTYVTASGVSLAASGTYTDTTTNGAGCDHVQTINYTTLNTTSSFSTTACNVYTAPSGATYTVDGTYSDTITNTAGCDSIMTISLVMFYDNNQTIFVTTCGEPYTSDAGITYTSTGLYIENYNTINGCDSLYYIDLTIAEGNSTTIDIDACDEYISDAGNVYSTTGSYTETYVGVTGCDSTITYNVTINTVDASVSQGVNPTSNQPSAILSANSAGATYQWVDCNNNFAPIAGETNQDFTAPSVGDFACIVTSNGCTDTSACLRVDEAAYLSVDDLANAFAVYPNPSTGAFTVELGDLTDNTLIEVYNAAGQVVYSVIASDIKTNIDLEEIANGLYIVSITNATAKVQQSIVIE